jgi:amino acid transporter
MGGWGVAVAGVVVLANLAQIGGIYFWLLIDESLAEDPFVVTATGVAFIALMTYVSWRGLEIGERLQQVLLAIQYLALIAFVVLVAIQFATGTAPATATPPTLEWFNPFGFTDFSAFVEAILLALFIYWGWDTCLALNEETKDPKRTPGRAAVLTTIILLVTYVGVTVAAMAYAGLGAEGFGLANEANADDVFFALKDAVFGPWSWLLVVAVMISAVSSTQTTILPTARGTLAMAVYRALPERFASVHPRFRTPAFSTLLMGAVAILFFVGMSLISDNLMQDTILSLGLAIAFYYAITGFACVWYFRRTLRDSARNLWFRGILPLIGASLLAAAFAFSVVDMLDPDYGYTVLFGVGGVFVVGVGSLALGAVLMLVWAAFPASAPFFRGEALNEGTEVLVPDDDLPVVRSVDGGL